jgi:hypothetical protein
LWGHAKYAPSASTASSSAACAYAYTASTKAASGAAGDGRLGIGVGAAEELGADDAQREAQHDAYRDAYREHLSGTPDGKALQANLPVSVEDMPWGHVQIAVASSYSLLLYNTLDRCRCVRPCALVA